MDGLRLSLIVVGVVVVALVYFWTARRRRIEREAGSFDRFHAWSDESRDPLVDDGDDPYRHLEDAEAMDSAAGRTHEPGDALDTFARDEELVGPVDHAFDSSAREESQPEAPARRLEPPATVVAAEAPATAPAAVESPITDALPDGDVLEGLEAIADSLRTRDEPVIGELSGLEAVQDEAPAPKKQRKKKPASARRKAAERQTELELTPPPQEPEDEGPEMVIVLNVMARSGERLEGELVHSCLRAMGLRYGEMQAYHFHEAGRAEIEPPLFSALNAVKPGTLDPADSAELQTPGIALVMRLPGPGKAIERFETMREVGERLAHELDAQLCDASRSTLTRQAANHLREQIAEYGRRRRLGA